MRILYTVRAREDLEGLPREIQKRIAIKMRFFEKQNEVLRFAKRLHDAREGEFRFRVGDYRIFFDVVRGTIYILTIKHRSNSY